MENKNIILLKHLPSVYFKLGDPAYRNQVEDNYDDQANHIYGITDDGIVISFSEVVARSKTYNLPKALLYE